jgi:molybdopterin synthase catalytic subunit
MVTALEYEAHEAMAEACMDALAKRARTRWDLDILYVRHRIGRIGIGETGLLVGVSAPHRREAFAACRFLVEGIKHQAPIWKRIQYDDGTWEWSGCRPSASESRAQEMAHALV